MGIAAIRSSDPGAMDSMCNWHDSAKSGSKEICTHSFEIFFSGVFEHDFSYDGNMILLHGKVHNRDIYNLDFEIHNLQY